LSDYPQTVESTTERIGRHDDDVARLVPSWSLSPLVTALQALRGVSLVSAAVMVAELGDLRRFENPSQLMAYLGLVPCEHSSGKTERKGGITRTGNANARYIIVEAAWAYRFPPRMSLAIRKRNELVASEVQEIAWRAQQRLYRKYRKLAARTPQKHPADPDSSRTGAGRFYLGHRATTKTTCRLAGPQIREQATSANESGEGNPRNFHGSGPSRAGCPPDSERQPSTDEDMR